MLLLFLIFDSSATSSGATAGCPWNNPAGWPANGNNSRCILWTGAGDDPTPCQARGIDGSRSNICCAYATGNGLPCSDKVYPTTTLDVTAPGFILQGQEYTLRIEGFRTPGSNAIAPYFLSDELQNTLQFLYARIVPRCIADPVTGFCGTQPTDKCAVRKCDAAGFCSLMADPVMLNQTCTKAGSTPAACASFKCVADYTLGATCDEVVDQTLLGQVCTPPAGSPPAEQCREYRCLADSLSTGAACKPAPWAQPIGDTRCPVDVGATQACTYNTCWNGYCSPFCAAFDERNCPVGTVADSAGAVPALCFRRACADPNPSANTTSSTCGCRQDWPFPEDLRCPNHPPVTISPPVDTPQDAQCNKYGCTTIGCDIVDGLTCDQYHPWTLGADQPAYDAQCWAPACTKTVIPDPIPAGFPVGAHYGRCEGAVIPMRASPINGEVCPPPIVNGTQVSAGCYLAACEGPYCSRAWFAGTPDQHLGFCPMPDPAVADDRCTAPYCDLSGQCSYQRLSGIKPTEPYWVGTTGERDFEYAFTNNQTGVSGSWPVGKCMYDDWTRADTNALRGQYAQPAPAHPRGLRQYSPDCLYARCADGHCAYEAFNYGNPCTPNADFCVDRTIDTTTFPDLPIEPPGATCDGVSGKCLCWACGAVDTPDAGFCIQQPRVVEEPLQVPCATGENCMNLYCDFEGKCADLRNDCLPDNVCYDATCTDNKCNLKPFPGRICGNETTNGTVPTCLEHGAVVSCCGDGILDEGEQCDYGYAPNASFCSNVTCAFLVKKKGKGKAALIGGLLGGALLLVLGGALVAGYLALKPATSAASGDLGVPLMAAAANNPTYSGGADAFNSIYEGGQ